MRKHQQRQILNLLQTIKRAQTLNLYADCRESAVGIGEFIDSIEGKGTQTSKLLTQYCELLSNAGNRMIGNQQLQKHLALIENSVNHELKPPDKIEVVFFPYNASMFDSMESIYLAAKNDPQCDAYVVPIPYYNLLPYGKFGQMHYEGDLYPDNIPITDWREYDVEGRNPDIIFIHTPYDEDNYVTSIHPDFYSKRLRNFTGALVYVPYFASVDDVPEWLCVHSGTVYADKIIVQSEKIKQTYIRVFKEFGKENNCEKLFFNLEDKIVALGSPKFDKIFNTKREDCPLPDKWRTLIERPDGTRKKVLLYNTSIGAMLQGNESYLKKLKSVLALFRERDDVVLWWRPHPLSRNTYQSMRPHLLKEYEQIVAEYKCEEWTMKETKKLKSGTHTPRGIYDDSPDLHRAIAMSDYLYSDPSSLIALYAATGKPIIEQQVNSSDDFSPKIPVRFGDFEIDDNGDIWAFELFRDGLFKLNFQKDIAEFVMRSDTFPQQYGKRLYTHRYVSLRRYKDELICFPSVLDNILIFDINRNSYQKIEISKNVLISPDAGIFSIRTIIEYKDKFYCFSPYAKAIIVFDAINKTITYQTKYFDDNGILTIDGRFSRIPLCFSSIDDNGNIELLPFGSGKLISYNVETQISKIIVENDCIAKCLLAERDNGNIWLFEYNPMILHYWNIEENQLLSFPFVLDGFQSNNESVFTALVNCGEYMLLFPTYSSMIVRFDKRTHTFSEYTDMPVPEYGNTTTYKYDNRYKRIGNKIFIFARFKWAIYELNTESGCIIEHKFKTHFPDGCSVFDFINETPKFKVNDAVDAKAGQRIYEYVKSLALERNE